MKKLMLILQILLSLTVSACAKRHYTKMQGDHVVFYYRDNEAREVIFTSSRDNYRLHTARETGKDLWEVEVPVGKSFAYFYIVDGVVTLPDCPLTENDDFGSRNCIYPAEL